MMENEAYKAASLNSRSHSTGKLTDEGVNNKVIYDEIDESK